MALLRPCQQWRIHGVKSGGNNIHRDRGARAYFGGQGALPPEADEISVIQTLIMPYKIYKI
jgi:hypothetical protein